MASAGYLMPVTKFLWRRSKPTPIMTNHNRNLKPINTERHASCTRIILISGVCIKILIRRNSSATMSLREVYNLAHTARCKLHLAADRPDRDLRFLVGHAMHMDSLMLRIIQIEESIDKPPHTTAVKFKGTGRVDSSHDTSRKSPLARKSPPPVADGSDSDSEEYLDDLEEDGDGLGLTRFPSNTAEAHRSPGPEPQLVPSDGDSSSEEDENDWPAHDPEFLRDVMSKNANGDEPLADMYNNIKNCRCHQGDAPEIGKMWELPTEKEGVRMAVAEITVN